MNCDTILLVQQHPSPASRQYFTEESLYRCLERVCRLYEDHLVLRQGSGGDEVKTVTYNISDLLGFIDSLPDLVCLLRKENGKFTPKNKDWIKYKVYFHLYNQAKAKGQVN